MSGSKWANPFKLKDSKNIEECLRKFQAHLHGSQHLMKDILDLCGRRLVCHCKLSSPCHGDVLIRAVADCLKTAPTDTTLLIGVPFLPQEFVQQASWLEHPFQAHYCSEVIERGLVQRMAMSTKGLLGCRADALEFWQNRKGELAKREKKLHMDMHVNVRTLMADKAVAVFREFLFTVGFPDTDKLVACFSTGFPLVAEFPVTGVFPSARKDPS